MPGSIDTVTASVIAPESVRSWSNVGEIVAPTVSTSVTASSEPTASGSDIVSAGETLRVTSGAMARAVATSVVEVTSVVAVSDVVTSSLASIVAVAIGSGCSGTSGVGVVPCAKPAIVMSSTIAIISINNPR